MYGMGGAARASGTFVDDAVGVAVDCAVSVEGSVSVDETAATLDDLNVGTGGAPVLVIKIVDSAATHPVYQVCHERASSPKQRGLETTDVYDVAHANSFEVKTEGGAVRVPMTVDDVYTALVVEIDVRVSNPDEVLVIVKATLDVPTVDDGATLESGRVDVNEVTALVDCAFVDEVEEVEADVDCVDCVIDVTTEDVASTQASSALDQIF
ncbi:hypothetical protein HDU84_008447 [Entophlyctis sp. JEL0112]|nr:hypothetical protein HDU84_008447 [Entophlyctis sp. JEL0112]